MTPCAAHEAMTFAEKACARAIEQYLPEDMPMCGFENPGRADCAVFDIGAPKFGDLFATKAKSLAYSAKLTLYRRDHDALQAAIMQLITQFPVNADLSADDVLRETSNVILLRVSAEGSPISAIAPETVDMRTGQSVRTFAVSISFDVVFAIRFD